MVKLVEHIWFADAFGIAKNGRLACWISFYSVESKRSTCQKKKYSWEKVDVIDNTESRI